MHSIEGQRQVLRLAVTPGHGEANIHAAVPAVPQAGMQRLVVGGLLGIIANQRYVVFGGLDRAARLGGDFNLAVGCA